MISRPILLLVVAALSAACEQLGIDDPVKLAAAKEAEARAVGSACRHSGRNLEDCYDTNPKASKAAIFAGWREMDAYMRENKIETVEPQLPPPEPPGKKRKKPAEAPALEEKVKEPASADKTAEKVEPAPADKATKH